MSNAQETFEGYGLVAGFKNENALALLRGLFAEMNTSRIAYLVSTALRAKVRDWQESPVKAEHLDLARDVNGDAASDIAGNWVSYFAARIESRLPIDETELRRLLAVAKAQEATAKGRP